jgi:hypothetical protein
MNTVKNKEHSDTAEKTHLAKYLMEIKELPSEYDKPEENKPAQETKPPIESPQIPKEEIVIDTKKDQKKPVIIKNDKTENLDFSKEEVKEDHEMTNTQEINLKPYSMKDIILNSVNALAIIGSIILLLQMPTKAKELRTLRNDNLHYTQSKYSVLPNISESETKAEKLNNLFLTRAGVIEFIKPLDELKKTATVTNYLFAKEDAVKDKTGSSALPVVVELKNKDLELMKKDVLLIEKLPFLFRPVSVEIDPTKDDPTMLVFKYGGFLYVDDKLGQTR